ncbi:hypothetical protein BU26DRAFT_519989 [Trematosphaeria pertusa]|uniref:Uncharacterized protein n=1 Tax=Trematosphaeria pertusa TaxID=390896 RepID=A0A6A6IDH9_9PLEO|nr:uncharacterized protein BU26DRAFT_519989 [Trematosphaeria pertusa]KAF2248267.1 hypothetical protein BU26DRAFT_519989 [Trematosphaeria pertusa]
MSRNRETTRTAIGPAAALGRLYDAKNDTVLSRTIFTAEIPEEAIESTDVRCSNYELCMTDTLEEKFSKLSITADLSASILGGLSTVSGSAKYLSQNKTSALVQQASIVCNITTVDENLRIANSKLWPVLDLDALKHEKATHVVVGIRWGARSVVTVKSSKASTDELLNFGGSLGVGRGHGGKPLKSSGKEVDSTSQPGSEGEGPEKREEKSETPSFRGRLGPLTTLIKSIGGAHAGGGFESDNTLKEVASSFEFKVSADVVMDGTVPATYEDVCKFIKSTPEAMQKANKGKGVPLSYQIVPIAEIARALGPSVPRENVVRDLDEDCLLNWIDYFDRASAAVQRLNDYYDLVSQHKHCVPAEHITRAKSSADEARRQGIISEDKFGNVLYAVRSGEYNMQALRELLAVRETQATAPEAALTITSEYLDKIKLAKQLELVGAMYMGDNTSDLQSLYVSADSKDLYVLYYNETTRSMPEFLSTYERLMDLLKNNNDSYWVVVVDCDVGSQRPLVKAFIEQVRGGKVVVDDVVQEYLELADKNLMRCMDQSNLEHPMIFNPPAGRRIVRIKCPGRHCSANNVLEWTCPNCRERVCFGFTDDYYYCDCGRYTVPNARFKCMSNKHGTLYEQHEDVEAVRIVLKTLDPFEEYNILILGETGVGKSTFINAFVNYMKFGSLDDALADEGPLQFAIPSEFSFDERRNERDETFHVTVGRASEFEQFSRKGQSATQKSVTYRFELDGKRFSLIDTPGIGDTRGVAQDHENMKDILNTLESVDKIHTVLLLLKPNSSRLGPVFNFCVTELLSHLHKDTSKNIVFGCTNARNTNFSFGDTRTPLETLLRDKATGISLGYHNSFFFDSEAFRYLAAKKLRNRSIASKATFEDSWIQSAGEARRLIRTTMKLPMHRVQETLALYRTRNMIAGMTKPMVAIVTAIKATKAKHAEAQKKLSELQAEGCKLEERLEIGYIVPAPRKLKKPRTVCSDPSCGKPVLVDDISIRQYTKICHEGCYIEIAEETLGFPELAKCDAFGNKGQNCSVCGHAWFVHLHVTYRVDYESQPNPAVYKAIRDNVNGLVSLEDTLAVIEKEKEQLDKANQLVQESLAMFGIYLKHNAMVAFNDAIIKYLDYQTEDATALGKIDQAKDFRDQKEVYRKQFNAIEDAIGRAEDKIPQREDLVAIVKRLEAIPVYGEQLVQMQEGGAGVLNRTAPPSVNLQLRNGNKWSLNWMKRFWG